MTQRHASTLELQEAARAGGASGRHRIRSWPGWRRAAIRNLVQNIPGLPGNFTVTFDQLRPSGLHVNGTTVFIYTFAEITATSGVYGTPEYVRRTARNVRITS